MSLLLPARANRPAASLWVIRALAAAMSLIGAGTALAQSAPGGAGKAARPAAAAAELVPPAIPRPKAAPVHPALEKALAAWDADMAGRAKECARAQEEPDFDLQYEVLLDTARLYSVWVTLSGFCGGAHGFLEESGLVFEPATGKRYDPLALYAIARAPAGQDAWVSLKPDVSAMIRDQLLARRPEDDEGCEETLRNDDIASINAEDSVALAAEGLRIGYSGGSWAEQSCYEPVTLPYPALKEFLDAKEAKRIGWKG